MLGWVATDIDAKGENKQWTTRIGLNGTGNETRTSRKISRTYNRWMARNLTLHLRVVDKLVVALILRVVAVEAAEAKPWDSQR